MLILFFTVCVVLLAVLAFFLDYKRGQKFTRLQKFAIAVGILAISFFAFDTLKPSDDTATAHLTHDPKSILLAHIYQDSVNFSGTIGIGIYQMSINNTTRHSLTVKSVDLKYDDLAGQTYTADIVYLWPGIVIDRPTVLFTSKTGVRFYLEDWFNVKDRIGPGKLLSPGETVGASAFYLLPTNTIDEIRQFRNFRIEIADFADHKSSNPFRLLDTMIIRTIHNKITPFQKLDSNAVKGDTTSLFFW
jgi:hypothetical protein